MDLTVLDLVPQVTIVLKTPDGPTKNEGAVFPCEIAFVNQAFKDKVTGFSELTSTFWTDYFEEQSKLIHDAVTKALSDEDRSEHTVRCKILCSPDNKFPVKEDYSWRICSNREKGLVLLSGERVLPEMNEEEKNELEELRDFFDNGPIAMHWLSGEGNVLWANKTEMETLGYTKEEYIGKPIMNFCPDEKELVLEIFKQLGSGNTIRDVPVRFRTKKGDLQHLLIDSNVKYHTNGDFHHTRCFIRDDTKRIKLDGLRRYVEQILGFLGHNIRNPLTTLLAFQDDLLHQEFDPQNGPVIANAIERLRVTTDETMMFQDPELMEKLSLVPTARELMDEALMQRSQILSNKIETNVTKREWSNTDASLDLSEASKMATLKEYFDRNTHSVFSFSSDDKSSKSGSNSSVISSGNSSSGQITKILHVEDDKMIQMISKKILKKVPDIESIDYADNGLLGVEAVKEKGIEYFDCIFMDIVMPEMDGFEASKQIRLLGYKGPIIAVSANVSSEQRIKAKEHGMSDFVKKPFTKKSLEEILKKWQS